jgi:hypothetical protein
VERWRNSTSLGVCTNNTENEVMLHQQPGQLVIFVAKIDPTTITLRDALFILGSNEGFSTKVVTLEVMMEMSEIVKQQPRDQREAHWQRLLRYLHEARYELPEPPQRWSPDPGDKIRYVRERGTSRIDVSVSCRHEQNVHEADRLVRSQNRPDSVAQVWRDALEQACLTKTDAVKSNVCVKRSL